MDSVTWEDAEIILLNICSQFNNNLLQMMKNVVRLKICADLSLTRNFKVIESEVNNPKNIKKFIIIFKQKTAVHRQRIMDRDESFFIGYDFTSESDGNGDTLNQIFEFKTVWPRLSKANKACLYQYLDILINLSDQIQ